MIKKVYSNRHRAGSKFDTKRKQYFSWGYDIRLADGHRRRESGFLSQAEVESVLARIRLAEKDLRYGFLTPRNIPTFRELCTKHVETSNNRREVTRARRVLAALAEELSATAKVTEILTTHLQSFVERRRKDGLSASSIDRELNIVSATLRAAVTYFPQLDHWAIPRIPRPKHSKRRRERVISAAEVTKVLTWLYAPQRNDETEAEMTKRRTVGHVFRVALLTGARKGELCKLRWEQIDWGAKVFQVIGTKTENRSKATVRYLKLTDTLADIFNERLAVSRSDFVFTANGGEVTHYYRIMRQACEACGVRYGRDVVGGFVTHDGRHTAVTRMLHAGTDLATIGSITGHKDKTLILHYRHATAESRDGAIDVLDDFAGKGIGRRLDTVSDDVLIFSGIGKGLVPEVGLEPT
jgi:integrase